VHVVKLWGQVRYLHPWLAYKDVDWDAALVNAIPKVRAAATAEQYAAAVQGMLDALADPATRVRKAQPEREPSKAEPPAPFKWIEGGVLSVYLRADAFRDFIELRKVLGKVTAELPKAKAVVIDLRARPGETYEPESVLDDLNALLASRPLQLPAKRYLVHSGYRGQTFQGSGGYFSGFMSPMADLLAPPPGAAPKRVVFLVNQGTEVPPVALALQAAGDGAIVAEGKIAGETAAGQRPVDLGEGYEALVRTSEIVPFPGWKGLHADAEVPEGSTPDAAFAAALRLAKEPATASPATAAASPAVLPGAVWRPDKTYPEMKDPSPEYRLLAVARIWNVIQLFYPYKHLIGDWDAVLPESITRMEASQGARGYALTLAAMAAHVTDGHTGVSGLPELDRFFGEAPAPVGARWLEDACVITLVRDDPAVKATGVAVGDVVVSVDGKTVAERFAELEPYVTSSTDVARRSRLCGYSLFGPKDSTAVLTLRGREGTKQVKLPRGPWDRAKPGEVVRLLPGNLGYVDLTRLAVAEVDDMFEKLKATRGIVFDMRGYPRGTAWAIAPRINTRGATYGATFRRAEVSAIFNSDVADSGFYFFQPLPVSSKWKYTGKTVMLIDERAISQSEHSGLFYEAANGTKFVGTPSAGANGDVTDLTLPGGGEMYFTGHDVRHADGRQLQRIGLVPDVLVAPTLQGLRDGKDEVLDRAMEVLNQELAENHP
ncbi:MAG TPA: S41 family peptidase, partial [Thermoanaerobaculia bacterium]|nr:S41 family peptidase [Thermoanaerobaculia bacterium]